MLSVRVEGLAHRDRRRLAGGGLTVATLVAIRDAKLATPGAGVCLSPWTDLEGLGDSMKTKSSVDPMVQKEALLEMAAHYLAGQDARQPLAAPLYATSRGCRRC